MKKKTLLNEVRQLQKIAGILKENTFLSERTIDISDIDFSNDGNRDQIFSVNATDEDIEDFENGNVETVWESDEYGGTFGVYKLPSGEYLYAFPDAEFYAKTPRGVRIIGDSNTNDFNGGDFFDDGDFDPAGGRGLSSHI